MCLRRVIPIIILCCLLALPAHAHTASELNEWLEDWTARRLDARAELVYALRWEYQDMTARHPGWDGRHIDLSRSPASDPASPVVPAAAPADRGMGTGVEQWRSMVAVYDWNVDIALCLMGYESGGNPNAYNSSSGASGLMQVLASWADNFGHSPADLFIPEVNLAISYALYVDGGWNHWSPWLRGACH